MGSIESVRPTVVGQLLIATAVIEVGAGVALLVVPSAVVRLLFGSAVEVVPAAGMARLAGAALLSLGAACWWAREAKDSRAIIVALLCYNAAVVALVPLGGLGPLGPPQWAAVVLHGVMWIWSVKSWQGSDA